jgi:pimeloyl-ACP methyl ester carboxylesterase
VIEVCYAQSGDVSIAYQVVGDGPIDLVFVAGAITNLEVLWEDPDYRRFCERLGTFSRLLLFDKRGMGLSDRVRVGTLEERMDDVRAVMDAAGSDSAALMGVSEGGPLSMLFAASLPERTRALVLCGAEVKEERTDDWPWGESTRAEFEQALDLDRVVARWGKGLAADHIFPNRQGDEAFRHWFGRLQVQSATPKDAVAFMRMAFEIDVRQVVPSIKVPTLIIHHTDDQVCHVENARWLARHVDGARYLELPGNEHVPWIDRDEILAETQEFLTGVREPAEPDRVLATVLFTDIVDSTARAAALGDRAWRQVLDRHDTISSSTVSECDGRVVKGTGDGMLATFDAPARGLRCADTLRSSLSDVGITIRAGVHTGEIELRGDDVSGIGVHIAARVAALAGSGELLASRTVKDLVAGSGYAFTSRGVHSLKGVPDEWELLAVS